MGTSNQFVHQEKNIKIRIINWRAFSVRLLEYLIDAHNLSLSYSWVYLSVDSVTRSVTFSWRNLFLTNEAWGPSHGGVTIPSKLG
jgi:hypothetical protein